MELILRFYAEFTSLYARKFNESSFLQKVKIIQIFCPQNAPPTPYLGEEAKALLLIQFL
jgi:hypothetical protein